MFQYPKMIINKFLDPNINIRGMTMDNLVSLAGKILADKLRAIFFIFFHICDDDSCLFSQVRKICIHMLCTTLVIDDAYSLTKFIIMNGFHI